MSITKKKGVKIMKAQLIVILLTYVGVPEKAAAPIALLLYIIFGMLIITALICVIKIVANTKKTTVQNEQIIQQNSTIIEQNNSIIQLLLNSDKNTIEQENTDFGEIAEYNQSVYNENTMLN